MIEIRKEEQSDISAIHQLNMSAFDAGPEAELVDRLRISSKEFISFVAVEDGVVVGHILFTPVNISNSSVTGMGLAPMAVLPSHKNKGIGSKLVRYGLNFLHDADCPFIIVLGHPDYYPRFGFEKASKYNLTSQWKTYLTKLSWL